MSLSLGFNVFVTSVLFLLFFHIVFIGLWYIGLVSRVAGRRPAILTILQNCAVSPKIIFLTVNVSSFFSYLLCSREETWNVHATNYKVWMSFHASFLFFMQVLSVACCIFYSHCGNRAILRERQLDRRNSLSWFNFWKKDERNTWLSKFLRMNELKDEVCSYWFAPVGSASDYPLLSKWVIYGEVQVEQVNDFSHHFVFLCYL